MSVNSLNLRQDALNAFTISDFFQILSVSLRLPNHELAKALMDGSYGNDVLSILEELGCSQEEMAQVQMILERVAPFEENETPFLIELRQEYTRLFDVPREPAVPIYETLFLRDPEEDPGKVMLILSPVALDAERCYQKAGVRLAKHGAEPADHMATELEFMMYLYAQKGKALQEQDFEQVARMEALIKEFADLHLCKWCWRFFAQLESEARQPFYRGLGQLAKLGLIKIFA